MRTQKIQLLLAAATMSLALPGLAQAQDVSSCAIEQLTDTLETGFGFLNQPDINADGSRITWTSFRDFTGENPDGNPELFLWEEGVGITQLTDTTVTNTAMQSFIDDGGTRIAFEGNADLVLGSNPDGNVEEFIWDEDQGFIQLTDTTQGLLCGKSISGDGRFVFFGVKDVDLTGGNPDLNLELYRYDVAGETLSQITSSTGPAGVCTGWSSRDGATVFFSTPDVVGPPNPEGNREIYRWREGIGIDAITTATSGDSFGGLTTADGQTAVFRSTADLVPGSNTDANFEVFVWSPADGIVQLTDTTTGAAVGFDISGDGRRIAFTHSADITGENPQQEPQIFLWDDGRITQVTDILANGSFDAFIRLDHDGSHLTFRNRGDVVPGGNADTSYEIYLARCSLPSRAVPGLSGVSLALLTLLLIAVAMFGIRKTT